MAATTHPYYIHELLAEEQCTVLSWVENSALCLETEFNILRCFWFENIGLKTNNGEYHRERKLFVTDPFLSHVLTKRLTD